MTATTILTVHGVGRPERPLEPGEEGTWISAGQLELALDAVAGRRDVTVTFDDANSSDVQIALPMLVERKIVAEFFIPVGLLGDPGRLDEQGVRELLAAGMRIGSHGWAHLDWRRLEAAQRQQEYVEAPRAIAALTGREVSRVAVPFGSYDRHVLRELRKAGVTTTFTSDATPARPGRWLQGRTSLRSNLDGPWLTQILDGRRTVVARARGHLATAVKRIRG